MEYTTNMKEQDNALLCIGGVGEGGAFQIRNMDVLDPPTQLPLSLADQAGLAALLRAQDSERGWAH